jgi:hypothetical protein
VPCVNILTSYVEALSGHNINDQALTRKVETPLTSNDMSNEVGLEQDLTSQRTGSAHPPGSTRNQ